MDPHSANKSAAAAQIEAGPFGAWLSQARASLLGNRGADVPCGDCVGCCVSSYYIPLRPEDKAAFDRIPEKHFISTSSGQLMLGYRQDGLCPMLTAGQCSIYAHRPQTCRDYDCRIFAAAGIEAGGSDKAVINSRVAQWRFTYEAEADRLAHKAVQSAAAFIAHKRDSFPGTRVPTAPTGIAVLAIKTYRVFLDTGLLARSDTEIACALIDASREFDAGPTAMQGDDLVAAVESHQTQTVCSPP